MADVSEQQDSVIKPSVSNSNSKKKIYTFIGVFILLSLVLILYVLGGIPAQNNTGLNNNSKIDLTISPPPQNSQNTLNTTITTNEKNLPDLIYGTLTGDNSVIKRYNLSTGDTIVLASLPTDIKKVSILPPNLLIYIDKTDDRDHGSRISIYDTLTKQSRILINAAAGYVIDDYVLSQNKKFISTWEVAFSQNSSVLAGGKSRLYVVNIEQPGDKKLLYDETADKPVHYPRMVMDNGSVFADTFMPNDPIGGTGWAYGMSLASFDGSEKKELDQMKAGTYSTQPEPALDGNYLVFAGYDGKNGPGDAVVSGYRQGILTPNTIELLDTKTLIRSKLTLFNNNDSYINVGIDKATGQVLVTSISKDPENMGLFRYDLKQNTKTKVDIDSTNVTGLTLISLLPENQLLLANTQDASISISNLGENYSSNLLQLYKFSEGKTISLQLQDPITQFITLLPGENNQVLGIKDGEVLAENMQPTDTIYFDSSSNNKKDNLQLHSFFVKLNLGENRINQQSGSTGIDAIAADLFNGDKQTGTRCKDLASAQCAAQGLQTGTPEFKSCQITTMVTLKTSSIGSPGGSSSPAVCYDSPLYLYGEKGQQVKVNINTPVYNSVPYYNEEYDVILGENGKMVINGNSYESIKYDYVPDEIFVPDFKYGNITASSQIEKVLTKYSKKLGLNQKETSDLINYARQKIKSQYVFVSFYPQYLSEKILPITFDPQPDNYLNIVFYFKQFDKYPFINSVEPIFDFPLSRSGFTAVEISGLVE